MVGSKGRCEGHWTVDRCSWPPAPSSLGGCLPTSNLPRTYPRYPGGVLVSEAKKKKSSPYICRCLPPRLLSILSLHLLSSTTPSYSFPSARVKKVSQTTPRPAQQPAHILNFSGREEDFTCGTRPLVNNADSLGHKVRISPHIAPAIAENVAAPPPTRPPSC
jgi:hypothetical protein